MSRHDCPGENCPRCARAIADIEDARNGADPWNDPPPDDAELARRAAFRAHMTSTPIPDEPPF